MHSRPIGDNRPDLIADSVLVGWFVKNEGQVREGQVRIAARSANRLEARRKLDERE